MEPYIPKVGDKVRIVNKNIRMDGQIVTVTLVRECCNVPNSVYVNGVKIDGTSLSEDTLHGPSPFGLAQYEPVEIAAPVVAVEAEPSWVTFCRRR